MGAVWRAWPERAAVPTSRVGGKPPSSTEPDCNKELLCTSRFDQGDLLIVTQLDRLARSTRDLLNLLDTIGKVGVGFKSLSDAWADTTTPHGRLMLTVLGGLAEFERTPLRWGFSLRSMMALRLLGAYHQVTPMPPHPIRHAPFDH